VSSIVYNIEPYGYSEKAVKIWQSKGYNYVPGSLSELLEFKSLDYVEILIIRLKHYIDSSVIDYLPNLKVVLTATTGLDHVNEMLLEHRKIELISLRPHKDFLDAIPSTAEHTWALLLSLIRNIPGANSDVMIGNWDRDQYRGYQLKNKTIGIIGLGRMGRKVAQYAKVFGMKVVFFDPFVENKEHLKVNKINELAKLSDIVSIHVHLVPSTTRLINNSFIESCKDNVYIINTSRGKVCDELALVNGIKTKKIKGVATDVLDNELINITNSQLWQAQRQGENVIITPHIGGATWDAMWDCEEFIANLIS
jgi:D-3-phosphoglycerate dehydrogenase